MAKVASSFMVPPRQFSDGPSEFKAALALNVASARAELRHSHAEGVMSTSRYPALCVCIHVGVHGRIDRGIEG